MSSRLSKLKTSIFGSTKDTLQQTTSGDSSSSLAPPQPSSKRGKCRLPVRYDCPDDSSEPSQYFKDHGHPWKAIRAPTPLPPFGTQEYYNVIKSNNPSPTTSNESEIGSAPDDISSKEEIYLSENPDLPETTHTAIPVPARVSNMANMGSVPETNLVPTSKEAISAASAKVLNVIENPLSSFVPVYASTSAATWTAGSSNKSMMKGRHSQSYLTKPKKLTARAATSSGEEAIFVPLTKLTKSQMNQSDPGLSSPSITTDATTPLVSICAESQLGHFVSKPLMQQRSDGSLDEGLSATPSRDLSASLTRQSAFDPGSSRENTPQK